MNTIQQLFIMTRVRLPAYSAENKMSEQELLYIYALIELYEEESSGN